MMDNKLLDSFLLIVRSKIKGDIDQGINLEYGKIDSYIQATASFVNATLSSEDYTKIFHDIEQYFSVRHIQGCAILNDYDDVNDWYKNGGEETYFWDRYRLYLKEFSGLDDNSIQLLDEKTLPEIMNCLGNPLEEFGGKRPPRKGLVIGDVQSGKTATYSGLICKAVDSGYKVVILLAGITESLRQQTQERIDEGIVGMTTLIDPITKQKSSKRVGVGVGEKSLKAMSYTTLSSDFIGNKDDISSTLTSHSSVVIFVIKKNVSVLTKLYNWLKSNNYNKSLGYIDAPLLLIDDEADNASLNTNKDETNPTKINSKIRKICDLFKNATYVGFTATPFANVFINPNSIDEMQRADLFPEHFMYVLPTPSTYIGADKIFKADGQYYQNLKYIEDIDEPDYGSAEYIKSTKHDLEKLNSGYFYYRHTKDWHGYLPKSLTESIYCFFLANIIRDMRGDSSKPRSMLVNMSRFIKVQNLIKGRIEDIYTKFYNCVNIDFKGDSSDNEHPLYRKLEALWEKHYSFVPGMSVERVLQKENILNAIKDIKIVVVNGGKNSGKLDYKQNPSLRAIAVGGIALSRGLTLEGLMNSYFYRNTATFDVLMQMGRWFGYRFGYEDIFQIWTSVASACWYEEVSNASNELKENLRSMRTQKLTPKDFGIKVREESDELQITAANKMRHAHGLKKQMSYYGNLHETPYVSLNVRQNTRNLSQLKKLVELLLDKKCRFDEKEYNSAIIVKDVPKSFISEFIGGIECSKVNPSFDPSNIKEFIDDENTKGVDMWDVVFQGGTSENGYNIQGLEKLKCSSRTIHIEHNAVVLSSRRRLLNTIAGALGLSDEEKKKVKHTCQEIWKKEGGKINRNIPAKAYFEYLPDRKPILIVLLIDPQKDEKDNGKKIESFIKELGDSMIAAFAVGFPGIKGGGKTKRYKVNEVYYNLYMQDEYEEDEDE